MLSTVLRSKTAINVSIQIMDAFTAMRQHQRPWQEVVRLQPHGNAHNRTVAKNALVEYNNLIFGS
jgi:hypothetical protein